MEGLSTHIGKAGCIACRRSRGEKRRKEGRVRPAGAFLAKGIAFLVLLWGSASISGAWGQAALSHGRLDAARDPSQLHQVRHQSLQEEYIWTAHDAAALLPDHVRYSYRNKDQKTEQHVFRNRFHLRRVPRVATLYIAGPRVVTVYINGMKVLDSEVDANSPLAMHVFRASVGRVLRVGSNVIAIDAIRGRGIVAASDSPIIQQMAFGESVVVKIVPAEEGIDAPPLVMSSREWRSVVGIPNGWESMAFDDRTWPGVQSLGAIESKPEFFQWNIDAGMYNWPGYLGMSPFLRTYRLRPIAVTHVTGDVMYPSALKSTVKGEKFAVSIHRGRGEAVNPPGVLLDFGREVAGRLFFESDCNCQARAVVSYGESESEALSGKQYLGANQIMVPAHGSARGPKSGFRYAWVRFTGGSTTTTYRLIALEGIAYPVAYQGSFESSDPTLNRIWEAATYTAHLCMQDGIWDAPKRDRGWWAGDLDVSGPVIGDVFGDHTLLEDTLDKLIPPAGEHVNGIPGYTAQWITTFADLYRRNGNSSLLQEKHEVLLQLLKRMDEEFDVSGRFLNVQHRWLFVDWAPGLFASTDEAAEGTELELLRGFRDGAWLLREIGDTANAQVYEQKLAVLSTEARARFSSPGGMFGPRWQLNAAAVLSGVADGSEKDAIWSKVLQEIPSSTEQKQTISPYFNAYLLDAFAELGHRREAVEWMRRYWGGMLAEGATSFWEAYDLRWPKNDPHASLQADGTTGYFVSLAHGWSSGPAAWMMEELLGIKPLKPGYRAVQIRPDLADLAWVRGAVATPYGPVRVDANTTHVTVSIPSGVAASLLLPAGQWKQNGVVVAGAQVEDGTRLRVDLHQAGRFAFARMEH